ncbi:MAG: InlB B-repeat-containing protein [Bacteroidales bacterium]
MKQTDGLLRKISFLVTIFIVSVFALNGQTMEKLIVYENFGGPAAGSSVSGITPDKWPGVHADSAMTCGWSASEQNLDSKGGNALVYQFHGNGYANIDTIAKYKTGGIGGLGITVNSLTKKWTKAVTLRNGYIMPFTSATSVDFGFFGAAVLPEFSSWISYASYTPDYLKNQTDEIGYIYTGKNVDGKRPEITIPSNPIDVFENLSKIEILFSGSRLGHNNTISIGIEEQNAAGTTLGTKKHTFSATIEPRLITIPNNKQYVRIHIDTWGSSNNANVTDYALLNNNTEIDVVADYNYNAIAGLKPDGTTTTGQTGNPGISIHMLKIYAKMSGSGYVITTNNSLVSGTKTGISFGATTTLTANATNGTGKKFMGWNIAGKPDLSEVVNPLTVTVTKDMTIMPVYAGDVVEVAVVDENFTDWIQIGTTSPENNNRLNYNQGTPDTINMMTGSKKIALRYGFTSGGKDSVNINLVKCNVIPQYGLRVYNASGWQNALGYVAFMGPNNNKGYVTVDTLLGITKALITLSSYDQPAPDRACAILVNDTLKRNKTLRTLYAEDVEVTNNPARPMKLQIGPGNQARVEYLENPNPLSDIFTLVSAAAVTLHNLKLYANYTVEDISYYKLTTLAASNGRITGLVPSSGNSTQHYLASTKVTLAAKADPGYGFNGWYDGSNTLISKVNPITITMDADKTIKPAFAVLYSYIHLTNNPKGTVTPSVTPYATNGDTITFYAGNAIQLSAAPVYGFKFLKWVVNGADQTSNPLSLTGIQMASDVINNVSVVYDSITDRKSVAIAIDTAKGNITFNQTPENLTVDGDTLRANFPAGETIQLTVVNGYGYIFARWKEGLDVAVSDSTKTILPVVMNKNNKLAAVFDLLPRYRLFVNQGANGTIAVTDVHRTGTLETQGLWPKNHSVEITATPVDGYELLSLGTGVSAIITGNLVKVKMNKDSVTLNPVFTEKSVFLTLKHNFQDSELWPMHNNNISNVPGAITFLSKPSNWDPTTYNDNLEALLTELAPYRVHGSLSNDNSDGPNGNKIPMTTLVLEYTKGPLSVELDILGTNSKAKATVVNYSTCNDCLIGKAVKGQNVTNYYLGHVTPGMVALKGLNVTNRTTETGPAFRDADSIGIMVIEGFVYVENVEVGYVAVTSQFCPGVFYTIDPAQEIIGSDKNFAGNFGNLWPLGQDFSASARPDQGNYGWGCAQEGMIMDKGMTVAEKDAPETKIILTSGYKVAGGLYSYSTIFIHDLKILGSPKVDHTFIELLKIDNYSESNFYMLGNTNLLQVQINEPVKAMVIYDINGKAIKVMRDIYNDNNQINVEFLKKGVYGVHCYGRSGEMYRGKFIKLND